MVAPKRLSPVQIINRLRKAEVALANGNTTKEVWRDLRVSEQTYYRWRWEYGGMKLSQAKRLKELEKENRQLKRAVAELTLVRSIPLPTQGPFPRRALPRVLSTTGPSATLPAQPAPRGIPVAACTTPTGLPVLLRSPSSMHADATTPAETGRLSRRSLPGQSAAFP